MPRIPGEFATTSSFSANAGHPSNETSSSINSTTILPSTVGTLPDGTKILTRDKIHFDNCTALIVQLRQHPNGTVYNYTQWWENKEDKLFSRANNACSPNPPVGGLTTSAYGKSTAAPEESVGNETLGNKTTTSSPVSGTQNTTAQGEETNGTSESFSSTSKSAMDLCSTISFVNNTENSYLSNGTIAVHTCASGYVFSDGSPMKTYECISGKWSGMNNDTCKPNSCPFLNVNLANAKTPQRNDPSLNSRQPIGAMVIHSCNTRHVFPSGEPLRIYECTKGGNWTGIKTGGCQYVDL